MRPFDPSTSRYSARGPFTEPPAELMDPAAYWAQVGAATGVDPAAPPAPPPPAPTAASPWLALEPTPAPGGRGGQRFEASQADPLMGAMPPPGPTGTMGAPVANPGGAAGSGRGGGGSRGGSKGLAKATLAPRGGLEGDATYQQLLAQLGGAESAALAEQGKGIKGLEAEADKLRAKDLKTDLSPALALYDSWFGTNTASQYTRPQTEEERDAQVLALEQAIQKNRGAMSDTEVSLIREKLGLAEKRVEAGERAEERQTDREFKERMAAEDRAYKQRALEFQAQMRQDAKDAQKDMKLSSEEQDDRNSLEKSKSLMRANGSIELNKAIKDYESLVDGVEGPIDNDAPAVRGAYTRALIAFKNAAELGALSGPDMGLVQGQISDASTAEAYFRDKLGIAGDKDSIKSQLAEIRKGTKANFDQFYGTLKEVYPRSGTQKILQGVQKRYDESLGVGTTAAAAPAATGPTLEELQAELARRKK